MCRAYGGGWKLCCDQVNLMKIFLKSWLSAGEKVSFDVWGEKTKAFDSAFSKKYENVENPDEKCPLLIGSPNHAKEDRLWQQSANARKYTLPCTLHSPLDGQGVFIGVLTLGRHHHPHGTTITFHVWKLNWHIPFLGKEKNALEAYVTLTLPATSEELFYHKSGLPYISGQALSNP